MRGIAVSLLSRALLALCCIGSLLSPATAEFTQADGTINNMGANSIPIGGTNRVIRSLTSDGLIVNGGPTIPLTDIPVGLSRWTWLNDTSKPIAHKNISFTFNSTDGYYYLSFDTPIDWSDFWDATATPPRAVAPGSVRFMCTTMNWVSMDQSYAQRVIVDGHYQANYPVCQPGGAGNPKGTPALGSFKIIPGSIVAIFNQADWCAEAGCFGGYEIRTEALIIKAPGDPSAVPGIPYANGEDHTENSCDNEVDNQVAEDTVPITGTGTGLSYSSDRLPGRIASRSLTIPSPAERGIAPTSVTKVEVAVAGKTTTFTAPTFATPIPFTWDGKDSTGATVKGSRSAQVTITYTTPTGASAKASSSHSLLNLDSRDIGLGGWALINHHQYEPQSGTLFPGYGGREKIAPLNPGVTPNEIIIPSSDGTEVYRFDSTGKHLDTRDAVSAIVLETFQYNASGAITSVTDRYGRLTTIERDATGTATGIRSPYGQLTKLTFDASKQLLSIENPALEKHVFTYTTGGLLSSITDPRGNKTSYGYDAAGLLSSTTRGTRVYSLSRGDSATGKTVTDISPMGRGAVSGKRTPNFSTAEYTATGTDGLSTKFTLSDDTQGSVSYPTGVSETLTYTPDPRFGKGARYLSSFSSKRPNSWTPVTATASKAVTPAWSKTGAPLSELGSLATLTTTQAVNGDSSSSVFTKSTKTLTTTSAAGRTSTTVFDAQFRPSSISVPKVDPVTITYDTHGRPTQMTHSTGTGARVSKLTYSTAGFVASSIDALNRTTTYTRDAIGRLLTVTRPDKKTVKSAYDKQGNLTQLTLPHGRIHSFLYNDVDDNTQVTPPSLGTWAPQTVYEYNLDRQLTKVTRPDGAILSFAYDPAIGRQTSETSPLGTKTFSYSATTGLLSGITGVNGYNLGFSYDGDAITKVNWTGLLTAEVGFYRNAKQQIETIYGSAGGTGLGNTNFTYDKDGFLRTANNIEITRDAQNGRLVSTKHGWMADSWSYSPFGEPSVYRAYYAWDNTTRYQGTYTRNKVGQITQNIEVTNGVTTTWDYTYNTLGWLTAVKKNGAAFQSYVYDANGNRTSIVAGGTTTTATYDAQDRLTVFGTTSYTYNNAGDLVSSAVGTAKTDFSYDIYGNLLSVKKPSGTTITYNVDPLGRRIRKAVNGSMVQGFLWLDELHPAAELGANGGIVAKFIYADKANVPSVMYKNGYEYRIISDHLGSVRMVVDNNNGAILQQLDYDPYGRVIVDTNPGFQPFGYAGGLYDRDTGLVRFGRRDYDPVVGRWTSKDPIGFAGGLNLYGYVVQDPVNGVDPSGLSRLLYDGTQQTITIFGSDGRTIGTYPAGNYVIANSGGPWPAGEYSYSHYNGHPESGPNDAYGSYGINVFEVPGRIGMGVHSGRANQGGPSYPTLGCIRTTDEGTAMIKRVKAGYCDESTQTCYAPDPLTTPLSSENTGN